MTRSIRAGSWARVGGCALLLSLPGCDDKQSSRQQRRRPRSR